MHHVGPVGVEIFILVKLMVYGVDSNKFIEYRIFRVNQAAWHLGVGCRAYFAHGIERIDHETLVVQYAAVQAARVAGIMTDHVVVYSYWIPFDVPSRIERPLVQYHLAAYEAGNASMFIETKVIFLVVYIHGVNPRERVFVYDEELASILLYGSVLPFVHVCRTRNIQVSCQHELKIVCSAPGKSVDQKIVFCFF